MRGRPWSGAGGTAGSPRRRRVFLAPLLRLARALDGVPLLALGLLARVMPRGEGARRGVCHVIHSLELGGGQRQFLDLARRHGHRDAAFVSLTDTDGPFSTTVEEVQVIQLYRAFRRNIVVHGLAYLFPNTIFTLALCCRLRRLRPTCVWGWMFLANVVAAPAARLAGAPRIVVFVENLSAWKTWPPHRRWWNRLADRNAARLADVVVVNSPPLVDDFVAWAKADRNKIVVLANGVDVEGWRVRSWRSRREELGIAQDEVVVLTVGRLAQEKNQAMLLRVSAWLHRAGVSHRLVVVGDGALAGSLQNLARELGIADHTCFAGATDAPQDFYRSADVFALSSDIEGLPNVLLEAQVFSLPVVTTAAGGAGEVVQHGRTGFVVPCRDDSAFALALRGLIEDAELRRSMGEAGRSRVAAEFSFEHWVREIRAITLSEVSPQGSNDRT